MVEFVDECDGWGKIGRHSEDRHARLDARHFGRDGARIAHIARRQELIKCRNALAKEGEYLLRARF